tara:strand:+ start:139 stop:309 length:171 start_codon:yes stop_codon:yes gene_type:complete
MKEIIFKVLNDFGKREYNLQSESARKIVGDKLEEELTKYVNNLIEDIVVGRKEEDE